MLATQIEVSDGTLSIINVGIKFFEQDDISVSLDQSDLPLVLGVDYVWSASTTVTFLPSASIPGGLVPNGTEVIIRRDTKNDAVYNILDGGAPFSRLTLDENYKQLLYLTQEFSEGLGLDGLRNNLNMNGYKVVNVGLPTSAGDAANKAYVDARDGFNLRTPEPVSVLPPAPTRANRVLGFDAAGNPVATLPLSGSGTELALALASADGGSLVGVKQADSPSLQRDLLSVYRDYVRIEDYVFLGGPDDTTAVQAAFDAAYSTGRCLVGRPGWVLNIASTITIDINTRYEGRGMTFVPVAQTSGTLFQIAGVSNKGREINGLRAICTKGAHGTLVGVTVGTEAGEIACWDPAGWLVEGFHINLRFAGNNVYIIHFTKSKFLGATLRNISWECGTNSGESITFSGGSISDAKNGTNTAVGVYVDPTAASPDIRISKGSMSYNDFNGDIAKGRMELYGVHEENKNVNPFWRVRNTVRSEKTVYGKYGGTLTSGPLSDGTEPLEGRDAFIVYDGSTTVIVRDAKLGTFREGSSGPNLVADYKTKVAKHSGVGGPAYRIRINGDIDGNRASAVPIDICPEISQVFLTGATAFTGFLQNPSSGVAFVAGTDGHLEDTRSRAITSTTATATTASYNLQAPVRPGQVVVAKVSVRTVGATACTYAGARLLYFTNTNDQIVARDLSRIISTPNNAAYVVQYGADMAPAGAAYVILQMRAAGLLGEVHFSNERFWIME